MKKSLFRSFAEKKQISNFSGNSPKKSTNLSDKIHKARNDLRPEIIKDIFHSVQKPYNLRNDSTLQRRGHHTVYFGTESISSLAPKIWEIVPCEIKNVLADFKKDTLAV